MNRLICLVVGLVCLGQPVSDASNAPATAHLGPSDDRHHAHRAAIRAQARNPSPPPHKFVPTSVVERAGGKGPFSRNQSAIGPEFPRQVHLFELPDTGKVLSCAGSGNSAQLHAAGSFTCLVYDWRTGVGETLDLPSDWYCGAGVFLADGNLLFSGGTAPNGYRRFNNGMWAGSDATYHFNSTTHDITRLGDMHDPRWYNNLVRNWFTENIYTFGGLNNGLFSSKWEVMAPGASTWSLLPWQRPSYSYEDFKVLDATHIAHTGVSGTSGNSNPYILDLRSGSAQNVKGLRAAWRRAYAAGLMLYPAQEGRVAVFGGGGSGESVRSTKLVDIVDYGVWPKRRPKFRPAEDMPVGVMFVLATNLPNGQVFVTGGDRQWRTGSVRWSAIYTPSTGNWTRLGAAKVARSYHSNIYTRQDGRVVTFGGNPTDDVFESRSEIFTPWYEFRPAPVVNSYRQTLQRGKSYGLRVTFPLHTRFGFVTLDSPRATTHSASDTGAGMFRLPAVQTPKGVKVKVPQGNSIPTGWYKLSVVTGGEVTRRGASGMVPSKESVWVRIVA